MWQAQLRDELEVLGKWKHSTAAQCTSLSDLAHRALESARAVESDLHHAKPRLDALREEAWRSSSLELQRQHEALRSEFDALRRKRDSEGVREQLDVLARRCPTSRHVH